MEFHETGMGKKYYMKDLPHMVETLGRIAAALESIDKKLESIDKKMEASQDRKVDLRLL